MASSQTHPSGFGVAAVSYSISWFHMVCGLRRVIWSPRTIGVGLMSNVVGVPNVNQPVSKKCDRASVGFIGIDLYLIKDSKRRGRLLFEPSQSWLGAGLDENQF